MTIDLQDTDVAALLRVAASRFAVHAAARRIDYVIDANDPCIATVDAARLQGVLMNLLEEAFTSVSDGGGVRCVIRGLRRELLIAIDDAGPASAERLAGGGRRSLAVATECIELHRGRLDVSDSGLGGTRVQITLPRYHLPHHEHRPAAIPDALLDRSALDRLLEQLRPRVLNHHAGGVASGIATPPRVLVVDRHPEANRFISHCLSAHYQVMSVFDDQQAIEMALPYRPALLLLDVATPVACPIALIARFRERPELQQVPILLLAAQANEDQALHLLDHGAQDVIVTPCSEPALLTRVRNLVLVEQARIAVAEALGREQRAREEAELQKRLLHSLFVQAPILFAVLRGPDHVVELANTAICQVWGHPEEEVLDLPLFKVIPELRDQIFPSLLNEVYKTGVPHIGRRTPARFERRDGSSETMYFDFIYSALRDEAGAIEGIVVVASEVTASVLARERLSD